MLHKSLSIVGIVAVAGLSGCRPLMVWRDPLIQGQVQVMGERGRPAGTENEAVTLNFIHHQGSLEETLLTVQTDPVGKYRSPKLVPGVYTVEAMLPGHVVEQTVVEVRSHEYKRVNLSLHPIGEAEGKTLGEAEEDNIQAPGQVQIARPK